MPCCCQHLGAQTSRAEGVDDRDGPTGRKRHWFTATLVERLGVPDQGRAAYFDAKTPTTGRAARPDSADLTDARACPAERRTEGRCYRGWPFAACPLSRNVFGNLPWPQILKEPKSLYHGPSGAPGSDRRHSIA
jgi:hypothetical protein